MIQEPLASIEIAQIIAYANERRTNVGLTSDQRHTDVGLTSHEPGSALGSPGTTKEAGQGLGPWAGPGLAGA